MQIINFDATLNNLIYELYQFGNLNVPSTMYRDFLKTYCNNRSEYLLILQAIVKLQHFVNYYSTKSQFKDTYNKVAKLNELFHQFIFIQCNLNKSENDNTLISSKEILKKMMEFNLENSILEDIKLSGNGITVFNKKTNKKMTISKYHLFQQIHQSIIQLKKDHIWNKIRLILISFCKKNEKNIFHSLPFDIIKQIIKFIK
jgi:hypothetical protein